MKTLKKIIVPLSICLTLVNSVFATIWVVPTQFPNVQAAINAASNGDTVGILPGTYSGTGNNDITVDKVLTIRGLKDNVNTGNIIFDPQTQMGPHIFEIDNPIPSFTGTVIIENIEFNKTSTVTVRAISVGTDNDVIIRNNIFRNLSVVTGGAISVIGTSLPITSRVQILDNYFENNGNPNFAAGQFGGGAILVLLHVGLELEISGNTFLNNHSDRGGDIHVNGLQTPSGGNPVLITRNTFNRDIPTTFFTGFTLGGDAIFLSGNMDAVIENNVITDHFFFRSLIQLENSRTGSFNIQHNLIYNNPSTQSGNSNRLIGLSTTPFVPSTPNVEIANNILHPLLASNNNTAAIADQTGGLVGPFANLDNNNMLLNNINTTHFPNITNNYVGQPLQFSDPSTLDYHPLITSPDIDLATVLNPAVLIDLDSARRTSGTSNDVGPYEFRIEGTIYPVGLLPDKEILKGDTLVLRSIAEPNTAIFCIVGVRKLAQPAPTPFGLLDIDPAFPWQSLLLGISDANGVLDFTFPIPASAGNIDLFYQVAALGSTGLLFGNTTEVRVRQ